jgi:hypothetical protein
VSGLANVCATLQSMISSRRTALENYPDWISSALKDTDTAIRIVAVIVAAVWAYMKFVKGRVFRSRLEAHVSGDMVVRDDNATLAISIKCKNVGLSRVDIRSKGSGLRVSAAEMVVPKTMISAEWRHLGTFPILEHHEWIEPGETVGEDRLAVLPKEISGSILLEAHIASAGTVWIATCIVAIKTEAKGS